MIRWFARRLPIYLATALISVLLFFIGAAIYSVARAQEPNVGRGIVCDTADQATRYVEVLGHDEATALSKVNEEVGDKDACVMWVVAFLPMEEVKRLSNQFGAYQIVRIIVFAAQTPMGLQASPPQSYYAVDRLPGHEI